MILEFKGKLDLRDKMPPPLPVEEKSRYLYLIKRKPHRYYGIVKISITSNYNWRMNDYGWHGDLVLIWSSMPLSDAKQRERELIELGNSLSGRRWGSKTESFNLRDKKLNRFMDAYRALAMPPIEYEI